jgi:hypothetical protein
MAARVKVRNPVLNAEPGCVMNKRGVCLLTLELDASVCAGGIAESWRSFFRKSGP